MVKEVKVEEIVELELNTECAIEELKPEMDMSQYSEWEILIFKLQDEQERLHQEMAAFEELLLSGKPDHQIRQELKCSKTQIDLMFKELESIKMRSAIITLRMLDIERFNMKRPGD